LKDLVLRAGVVIDSKIIFSFKDKGCYLDDICHEPKTYKEICENKDHYIKELQSSFKLFNPQAIIITPKRIDSLVRAAIKQSNISIKPELIFTLPFPGNGWQNKYMEGLWGVLHFLNSKNVLTKVK
jgi:hypothetical protein